MRNSREAEILREIQADAVARQKALTEIIDKVEGGASTHSRAQLKIAEFLPDVIESLTDLVVRNKGRRPLKDLKVLRSLPVEKAAAIALVVAAERLGNPAKPCTLVSLLTYLGKELAMEASIEQLREKDPLLFKDFQDKIDSGIVRSNRQTYAAAVAKGLGDRAVELTQQDAIEIGKFAYLALESSGFVRRWKPPGRKPARVLLADQVAQYVMDVNEADVSFVWSRRTAAMHYPPDPWTNLHDGGYLTASRKALTPLLDLYLQRPSDRQRVRDRFTEENMPLVFDAVNYMQSMPYGIHEPTRKAILAVWGSGGGVLGVPLHEPPKEPLWPFSGSVDPSSMTEEQMGIYTDFKVARKVWYERYGEWLAGVRDLKPLLVESKDVDLARYYPMHADQRGRMYYRGYPNPQGTDMAKGLLCFKERKPLGKRGLFWLKVHIANSWGFDKPRFKQRAAWVDGHWKLFEEYLDEPWAKPEVFGDNPWSCYAAAWELREAYRSGDPESYACGIICDMDATCSGLQHFSALLLDASAAKYVNLLDNGEESKSDIYTAVADRVIERLKQDTLSDAPETAQRASWWLGRGVPRAMAKKPVMTYSYSATVRSAAEHVFGIELERNGGNWRKVGQGFKDCMYLGRLLFEEIERMFPAAATAMKWLQNLAKSCGDRKLTWETPSGFEVQQDYRKTEVKKLKLFGLQRVVMYVQFVLDTISSKDTKQSIAPNYVHSLDASLIVLTALRMQDAGLHFRAIHDCCGTHVCDVDYMHKVVRESFVRMYKDTDLLNELRLRLNSEVDRLPLGTLDIEKVLTSEFFFC